MLLYVLSCLLIFFFFFERYKREKTLVKDKEPCTFCFEKAAMIGGTAKCVKD